jgi:pentatricopeptide repeat protein
MELGESDRAIKFFEKLSARDVPSIRAYMTVLRVYSQRKDWETSKDLITQMHQRGAEVDSLALNMVLSTGVAAMKVDTANNMLSVEPWTSIADVVSHNIILKGLAQQGETTKALALLDSMRQRNVTGNHITYNTAIDAAVRGHRVEDAWTLFGDMRDLAGLLPDKCTASTMVKALQLDPTVDRLEGIASLLQSTVASCPVELAGRLFANTLQIAVRLKDLTQAMRIFATMQQIRSEPPATCNGATFVDLAVLAARMGDAASCATLWKQALPDVSNLRAAKTSVTQELANGGDICAVTLRCLGPREQNNSPKGAVWRRPGAGEWR